MTIDYSKHFQTRETPQYEKIPGKVMVKNSAGGYVYPVDAWAQLQRFLIIGTEGGTYYTREPQLTKENAQGAFECIQTDGERVVKMVVEISHEGRAPKNDPALFVLAMCAGTGPAPTRKAALAALPQVARIGTHLFTFANYVQAFRGWGRGLRDAVANWYQDKPVDKLAYQAIKYQQRGGWSHRDLLRLAHPKTDDKARNAIYKWIVSGYEEGGNDLPEQIVAMELAKEPAQTGQSIANLIKTYNLPREAIPTEYLDEYAVWEALFMKMPITAMIRNLGKMTSIGLLEDFGYILKACEKLTDPEILRKGRVHPITILAALRVYKEGRGFRGSLTWNPSGDVLDALDDAFYLAFKNVEPSGQRIMIGLDVSSSMDWSNVQGLPFMTARDAACTMAMVTYKAEKQVHTMAFATKFQPLDISRKQRLDGVINSCKALNFGGTDCALPMIYALKNKIKVDLFAVYTDNETWAGHIHPSQALQQYREQMDIPARLVVAGMASNGFSIADPTDAGMMDVVGFDTAAPQVISQFAKGNI